MMTTSKIEPETFSNSFSSKTAEFAVERIMFALLCEHVSFYECD